MRTTLLLAALALLVSLAGCNTMEGFGEDVEKVGSEIEEAAS
nr:entericidin A/B family lipoprotein [uncultured Halomonas sp.]